MLVAEPLHIHPVPCYSPLLACHFNHLILLHAQELGTSTHTGCRRSVSLPSRGGELESFPPLMCLGQGT